MPSFSFAHPESPENRSQGFDSKFKNTDTNSDGLISKEEFRISHQQRMEKHFAKSDLDNDNHLSKKEMKKSFRHMKSKLNKNCRMNKEEIDK